MTVIQIPRRSLHPRRFPVARVSCVLSWRSPEPLSWIYQGQSQAPVAGCWGAAVASGRDAALIDNDDLPAERAIKAGGEAAGVGLPVGSAEAG